MPARCRATRGLRRHLARRTGLRILDLGSGTGRFAPLLADAFDADVLGIEPAPAMRAEAARHGRHPRVLYADGSAAAIPAADGELDAAFLSMVIHPQRLRWPARRHSVLRVLSDRAAARRGTDADR